MKFEKAVLIIGVILCFTLSSNAMLDVTFMPRWIVLAAVTLILTVSLSIKESLIVPKNLVVPAFLFYLLMAIISLLKAYNTGEGLFEVCKITLLFCFLLTACSVVKDIKELARPFAVLILAIGIYGLCYTYIRWEGALCNYATMGHKNLWSQANLLFLPFCLYLVFRGQKTWRIIGILASITAFANIVIPQTRSAILALVVSAMFFRRKIAIGCLLLIAVVGVFLKLEGRSLADLGSLEERFSIWKQTAVMAKDRFMVGAGNWQLEIPNYAEGLRNKTSFENLYITRPHNDYLWVASELSPIGLIPYVLIFAVAIFYARHNPYVLMGLISYAVIAFFSFPKERASLSMMLIIFIALAISKSSQLMLNKTIVSSVILAALSLVICNFAVRVRAEYLSNKLEIAHAEKDWFKIIEYTDDFILPSYITIRGIPIYYYRGIAYELQGDYERAFYAYQKAAQAHKNHLNTLGGLGICYYEDKQYAKAAYCYRKLLLIKPNYPGAIQNLKAIEKKLRGVQ